MKFNANNPLNNSSSKQLFSFPKGKRQFLDKTVVQVNDQYYDMKSSCAMTKTDNKKTPSFGVGQRLSVDMLSPDSKQRPGPAHYTIASEFDQNKTSKCFTKNGKGFTFNEPHSKFEKVYNESVPPQNGTGPDAGLYNIKSFVDLMKHKKISFGIGKRESQSPKKIQEIEN